MGETIYTRSGPIRKHEDRKPIRTYRVPTATDDEIRINIPISATKQEIALAIDIMQAVCRHWEGEDEEHTDGPKQLSF